MDALTEAAVRAFMRLHKATEAVVSDPHHPSAEASLTAAATEANRLMKEAGLLGQPEHVVYGLVRELYPQWRPTNPDRGVSMLLVPDGPLDQAPLDPRFQAVGELTSAEHRELILRVVLARGGVKLGKHDDLVVATLAETTDWATLATVASWIKRAATSGPHNPKG